MVQTDPGEREQRARPSPHLKAQRARLGLTQQEVAEALAALAWEHDHEQLGVDTDMVSKWERGAGRPPGHMPGWDSETSAKTPSPKPGIPTTCSRPWPPCGSP